MENTIGKRRITLIAVGLVAIVIALVLTLFYTVDTILCLKSAQAYTNQIMAYQEELEREREIATIEHQKRIETKLPTLTEEGKNRVRNIYKSNSKIAYLTFDDGPTANTERVLDILKEKEISAAFFVLGNQVEKFPHLVKRIYDEGHYVANHGYSHVYQSVYSSTEEVLGEYNHCNELVKAAIGQPEYSSHLFRFPGGYNGGKYFPIKEQASVLLEENDVMYIDWNALTGDSQISNPSSEYLMENLQITTEGKNSVVILMHDSVSKKITVDTLSQVIDHLIAQGYEFGNFYDVIV